MARDDITKEDYRRYIRQRVSEIEDIKLLAGIWIFVNELACRKHIDGTLQDGKQED